MSDIKDDIHDQLTKAYLEYFKANETYEAKNSVRTTTAVRRCLRTIRTLAKQRMDQIAQDHKATRITKKDKNL